MSDVFRDEYEVTHPVPATDLGHMCGWLLRGNRWELGEKLGVSPWSGEAIEWITGELLEIKPRGKEGLAGPM